MTHECSAKVSKDSVATYILVKLHRRFHDETEHQLPKQQKGCVPSVLGTLLK